MNFKLSHVQAAGPESAKSSHFHRATRSSFGRQGNAFPPMKHERRSACCLQSLWLGEYAHCQDPERVPGANGTASWRARTCGEARCWREFSSARIAGAAYVRNSKKIRTPFALDRLIFHRDLRWSRIHSQRDLPWMDDGHVLDQGGSRVILHICPFVAAAVSPFVGVAAAIPRPALRRRAAGG